MGQFCWARYAAAPYQESWWGSSARIPGILKKHIYSHIINRFEKSVFMEYVEGVQKVSSIFVGRAIQTEWGGGAATNGGAKQILQHKPKSQYSSTTMTYFTVFCESYVLFSPFVQAFLFSRSKLVEQRPIWIMWCIFIESGEFKTAARLSKVSKFRRHLFCGRRVFPTPNWHM